MEINDNTLLKLLTMIVLIGGVLRLNEILR